jgi:hypothetical protein
VREGPALTRRPLFLQNGGYYRELLRPPDFRRPPELRPALRVPRARFDPPLRLDERPPPFRPPFLAAIGQFSIIGVKLLSTGPPVDRRDSGDRRSESTLLRESEWIRAAERRRR